MKLILLFSILSFAVVGQEMNQLQGIENSLSVTLDSLRSASSDSLKIELNKRLKNQIKECLTNKAAFSYPFQKLTFC